jgi:hypothetical protein
MVACLSAVARLGELVLEFFSPESCPIQASIPPPPPTRAILPALTHLQLEGTSGYLEDFVARIDTPLLNNLSITDFIQDTFNTPQMRNFISRTKQLRPSRADITFYGDSAAVMLHPLKPDTSAYLGVSPGDAEGWISSLGQLCISSLSSLSTLDRLDIRENRETRRICVPPPVYLKSAQWLEILRPFAAVRNLHLDGSHGDSVLCALREHAAEMLPVLQNFFLEKFQPYEPLQEAIGQFVAARRLSGHTITVHQWK